MKRNKKINIQPIVMILFALAVVFVILLQVKTGLKNSYRDYPVLLNNAAKGIVDLMYYNYTDRYSVQAPDSHWSMTERSDGFSLALLPESESMLNHINWQLQMDRMLDDNIAAQCFIGVARRDTLSLVQDQTIDMLANILDYFEHRGKQVQITKAVTQPAHHLLQGFYFAVEIPKEMDDLNVWIFSVLPRDDLLYIIYIKTNDNSYSVLRTEFEKITQRFHAISKYQDIPK